ncbi:MAG: sulfotransferase domain-containing protein [Magnetococcales bacterium]|nr:sulfotransferase domain-containing protein [Magnetococcales bacterium]
MTQALSRFDAKPIINLTLFKSGTHLLRQILEDLTGLPFHEPPITPGRVNYRDSDQLQIKPGSYYSWHLHPTDEVRHRIRLLNGRPVLLVRNIYDMTVSMYHHFAKNIDAELGRGRNVDHYFKGMSRQEGMSAIINGMVKPDFHWPGLGFHLKHMQEMFLLAQEYPSWIISYEQLVQNKAEAVRSLAAFLDIELTVDRCRTIVEASGFEAMKARADSDERLAPSHFRHGKPKGHLTELTKSHCHQIKTVLAQAAPQLTALAKRAGMAETVYSER